MVFLELRRDSRVTTGISAFPLGWPWEAQSSPRVARESWGLRSSHCRAEETSPRRVSGTYSSSPGKAGISGLHSRLPRGVRPRLEGKPRTPLSSRVATRFSWSPLSGLKGVQPPLPFGERTRDCSPGHAGKEGPQLARTGASQGFPRAAAPVGVFSRGTRGSLRSSSYLVRKSTLARQLEETHETNRSSRDEGLIFLHGLETYQESSIQTEEEAGLP